MPHEANVTRDDISNSLTKHAYSQEGASERAVQLELASRYQNHDPRAIPARTRNRGSIRGALVIFLGGLLAVWLYGYVTGAYEIPYFRAVTQSPEVQVGVQFASSNPILLGAVSASVLLGALYLRHGKKN